MGIPQQGGEGAVCRARAANCPEADTMAGGVGDGGRRGRRDGDVVRVRRDLGITARPTAVRRAVRAVRVDESFMVLSIGQVVTVKPCFLPSLVRESLPGMPSAGSPGLRPRYPQRSCQPLMASLVAVP